VKRPSALASIDAAAADVKSVPRPPSHFRWTSIPSIRRLKGQFDGDWLSPRSKNRTERTGATGAARAACRMEPHVASDRGGITKWYRSFVGNPTYVCRKPPYDLR